MIGQNSLPKDRHYRVFEHNWVIFLLFLESLDVVVKFWIIGENIIDLAFYDVL